LIIYFIKRIPAVTINPYSLTGSRLIKNYSTAQGRGSPSLLTSETVAKHIGCREINRDPVCVRRSGAAVQDGERHLREKSVGKTTYKLDLQTLPAGKVPEKSKSLGDAMKRD